MQCFLPSYDAENRAFLHRMVKHLLALPFHHAVGKSPLENKNVSEKSPCYQILRISVFMTMMRVVVFWTAYIRK
jgi:hypothetical protein